MTSPRKSLVAVTLALTAALTFSACGDNASETASNAASVASNAASEAGDAASGAADKASSAVSGAADKASSAASDATDDTSAAASGSGTVAGDKVDPNTASADEITAALEKAGVSNAAKWAKEIEEYKPYQADTMADKLKSQLGKYGADAQTVQKIISVLQVG